MALHRLHGSPVAAQGSRLPVGGGGGGDPQQGVDRGPGSGCDIACRKIEQFHPTGSHVLFKPGDMGMLFCHKES